jgi:hypothetical protein
MSGWVGVYDRWQPRTMHVVPISDVFEHDNDGTRCPCGPSVDPHGTIIHDSLDGREHEEPEHDRDDCPVCTHPA